MIQFVSFPLWLPLFLVFHLEHPFAGGGVLLHFLQEVRDGGNASFCAFTPSIFEGVGYQAMKVSQKLKARIVSSCSNDLILFGDTNPNKNH
ncbi:hypothetical protein Ancab_031684 [Ancistrocladus abbreviatus]